VICRLLEPCVEAQRDAADGITDLPVIHFTSMAQLVLELRVGPDTRQHRIECERHEQRNKHCECDGDAELEEYLSYDSAHEGDGNEHRHDGECGRDHRHADLVRPFHRRLDVVLAHLDVSHDVFAHDYRVIYEQADRERQSEERHRVHREVEEPHHEERGDDAHRERESGYDRRAPRVEEQIHDRDRENGAEYDVQLNVGQRLADALRVIADHGEPYVAGHDVLEIRDCGVHRIRDFHGVGAGNLLNVQR